MGVQCSCLDPSAPIGTEVLLVNTRKTSTSRDRAVRFAQDDTAGDAAQCRFRQQCGCIVRPLRVGADLVCNEVVDTRFTRSRGTNGVGGGVVSAIYDNPTHQPVGAGAHDSPYPRFVADCRDVRGNGIVPRGRFVNRPYGI